MLSFRLLEIIHFDQGWEFESLLLCQTLDALGIKKSCKSAYKTQGDVKVERFNRSLLQLLQTCIELEDDWEHHLLWALFAHRSAVNSSTGVSPFWKTTKDAIIASSLAFDSTTYNKQHLCAKFAQLLADLVEAGLHQKAACDSHLILCLL